MTTSETAGSGATAVHHPLEPLDVREIAAAARIVREHEAFSEGMLLVSIYLHEPPKETVLGHRDGDAIDRQAFVVLRDRVRSNSSTLDNSSSSLRGGRSHTAA